jgi:hypothetical protein
MYQGDVWMVVVLWLIVCVGVAYIVASEWRK